MTDSRKEGPRAPKTTSWNSENHAQIASRGLFGTSWRLLGLSWHSWEPLGGENEALNAPKTAQSEFINDFCQKRAPGRECQTCVSIRTESAGICWASFCLCSRRVATQLRLKAIARPGSKDYPQVARVSLWNCVCSLLVYCVCLCFAAVWLVRGTQ